MIKNIVFDVGKVLIDWNPYDTMKELGLSQEAIDAIKEKIFNTGIWSEEDRGLYTPDKMADYFVSFIPEYEKEMRLFYQHATDSVKPRPYVLDLFDALKNDGYNIYILSNFGESAWQRAIEIGGINFLHKTDGRLVSYEIHHVKPEAQIYNALYERFSLIPDECLFLDDLKENIEGAKATGMNGIVYTTIEEALKEMKKYNINISI